MKTISHSFWRHWTVAAFVAVAIVFCGCKKKEEVDTSKLEKSFQSAEPATQGNVDKAVASVRAGDYAAAMGSLQQLASQAKLTPEQQQAVKDVVDQLQAKITETVKKATDEVKKAADEGGKALDDLKKSLPK